MNKNLQSPTKLTEFAPLQSEGSKPQTVGQFITSIFKKARNVIPEDAVPENAQINQESLPNWAIESNAARGYIEKEALPVYNLDVNEGRSLPNVLKRISNLVALKSTNLQDYGDTELKQYWMPDSVSKECYECSEKFTTFRRRHHCRVCGQIFCSQCCNQQIPGKIFGCTGDLRVCTYCCKVVLSYLQSSDFNNELSTDLKVLQENLQSKFGSVSHKLLEDGVGPTKVSAAEGTSIKRKISVGYQEEKFNSRSVDDTCLTSEEKIKALQNSSSLRNLYEEIYKPTTGVQFETHRHRLKNCNDCILGSDLVDWLIFQQKAKNRIQASAICQALLAGGYIKNTGDTASFIDGYSFYKKGVISSQELPKNVQNFDIPSQEEPSWVQQIPQESSATDSDNEQMSPLNVSQGNLTSTSSYMLDLNLEANTVYLSRPLDVEYSKVVDINETNINDGEKSTIVRPSEQVEKAPTSGWFKPSVLREENGEKMAFSLLNEAYKQHEENFLKQLLSVKGMSHTWSDIVIPLIHDIVSIIRPDKNHDAIDLDIRHYLQFKILTGSIRTETKLIGGIVCSKNVAHKGMATDIANPKVLLLHCSIVYQRTEGRLMSLEPVLMQEHEYLRHVAARIVALQPDVVLVHKNVSRLAQDMLRQAKITLVHNVKQSVLERLSRCMQADLVTAVDAHIGRPKLGTCKRFYVQNFTIDKGGLKTLMFFEGLPNPHLGGTVLLRGGTKSELNCIKKIASLMLFTVYNWRLEHSLLMDEFACPPSSKCEFLDDSRDNSPELSIPKSTTNSNIDNTKFESIIKKNEPITIKKEKPDQMLESKKITVETIEDFTDPLHSDVTHISNDANEKLTVTELPLANSFRNFLDDTILCASPYIVFAAPYLESESGKKSNLRKFFPKEIYLSEQFNRSKKIRKKEFEDQSNTIEDAKEKMKQLHPFLMKPLTTSIDNPHIQNMLAHFRACGGTYEKRENICRSLEKKIKKIENEGVTKDVLDPTNHQRLAVLFCSFSSESDNAPAFCVNPWVVFMDFYGRNDIPLGCFLERYCFRSSYNCPSKSCDTPMVKHIRRFVHYSGCISIILNYFENEFSEDHIVMWTWCTKCQTVSPVVPMSDDSWSYSFAKYLELKFYGDIYTRRGQSSCTHSLHHDHYQYFGYKKYVASFKYSPIDIWEISLPPPFIEIKYDTNEVQNQLIDEVRVMAQKGHEIFSFIYDKLSSLGGDESDLNGTLKHLLSKEQTHFKQKVEEIQLKLTSPSIENKEFEEKEIFKAYWRISDALVKIKRSIAETIDVWNVRIGDVTRKKDGDKKKDKPPALDIDTSTLEDSSVFSESQENVNRNSVGDRDLVTLSKKVKSLDGSDNESGSSSPKSHHRSQSDAAVISHVEDSIDGKKDSDKNKVKTILSHLLPSSTNAAVISSPFNSNEHYTLPESSSIPIVVYETEPSSIVAYALNSNDYKKAFEELVCKRPRSVDHSPSPVSKRKSQSDMKNDDDKASTTILGFLRNKESKCDTNGQAVATSIDNSTEQQSVGSGEKVDSSKKNKNSHIEVQFQDSNCNFFCRIYMADKFAELRSLVLPLGEEAYIRSLSRSIQWNARGGKSGSNFAKTADDRFILKDMSKSEVQLFLESASNYFVYMNKCFSTKQPTLLGKIVGIYQIVFKNSNNVPHRSNLLVMENLFYNRKVCQKFDLKGSMRNRLVVPDNQEGEIVLLDENLLKMTCDSPLYILPHSKSVLLAAIQNDTEFLSTQSVMDYSLLVGLSPDNKELVLGIIDYIRTFTWDKRLETMVKKSGILGGQGKLPTIVSPEEYQKRFIEAMHRYFLEVPDHWTGLGRGVDL